MKLLVDFEEDDTSLEIQFIQTTCKFSAEFDEMVLVSAEEIYTGDYNVTPRVYEQILETKDKLMLNDVTVEIIPLARVLNQSNGYTVTIG